VALTRRNMLKGLRGALLPVATALACNSSKALKLEDTVAKPIGNWHGIGVRTLQSGGLVKLQKGEKILGVSLPYRYKHPQMPIELFIDPRLGEVRVSEGGKNNRMPSVSHRTDSEES